MKKATDGSTFLMQCYQTILRVSFRSCCFCRSLSSTCWKAICVIRMWYFGQKFYRSFFGWFSTILSVCTTFLTHAVWLDDSNSYGPLCHTRTQTYTWYSHREHYASLFLHFASIIIWRCRFLLEQSMKEKHAHTNVCWSFQEDMLFLCKRFWGKLPDDTFKCQCKSEMEKAMLTRHTITYQNQITMKTEENWKMNRQSFWFQRQTRKCKFAFNIRSEKVILSYHGIVVILCFFAHRFPYFYVVFFSGWLTPINENFDSHSNNGE